MRGASAPRVRMVIVGTACSDGSLHSAPMDPWSRVRRKTAAWIALVAMLAGTLLPTVSHALASARGEAWTAVCTAQGVRWVAADAIPDGAGDAAASTEPILPASTAPSDLCPVCSLSVHLPGLPPASTDAVPPDANASPMPGLFRHAPRTQFAWLGALPRAPPSAA